MLGDDGKLGRGEGHLSTAFTAEYVGMHTDLRSHFPLADAGTSELGADNARDLLVESGEPNWGWGHGNMMEPNSVLVKPTSVALR